MLTVQDAQRIADEIKQCSERQFRQMSFLLGWVAAWSVSIIASLVTVCIKVWF
mgnify:CR=1 FL=1